MVRDSAMLMVVSAAFAASPAAPAYSWQMVGSTGQTSVPGPSRPERPLAMWKVKGDRSVQPIKIGDNGVRTYLEWGVDQPLPAVFAIGPAGGEQVVDGYMRDGIFVIDRVHGQLVFRIDNDRAIATRKGAGR